MSPSCLPSHRSGCCFKSPSFSALSRISTSRCCWGLEPHSAPSASPDAQPPSRFTVPSGCRPIWRGLVILLPPARSNQSRGCSHLPDLLPASRPAPFPICFATSTWTLLLAKLLTTRTRTHTHTHTPWAASCGSYMPATLRFRSPSAWSQQRASSHIPYFDDYEYFTRTAVWEPSGRAFFDGDQGTTRASSTAGDPRVDYTTTRGDKTTCL